MSSPDDFNKLVMNFRFDLMRRIKNLRVHAERNRKDNQIEAARKNHDTADNFQRTLELFNAHVREVVVGPDGSHYAEIGDTLQVERNGRTIILPNPNAAPDSDTEPVNVADASLLRKAIEALKGNDGSSAEASANPFTIKAPK